MNTQASKHCSGSGQFPYCKQTYQTIGWNDTSCPLNFSIFWDNYIFIYTRRCVTYVRYVYQFKFKNLKLSAIITNAYVGLSLIIFVPNTRAPNVEAFTLKQSPLRAPVLMYRLIITLVAEFKAREFFTRHSKTFPNFLFEKVQRCKLQSTRSFSCHCVQPYCYGWKLRGIH
jgi:hypothetical protein